MAAKHGEADGAGPAAAAFPLPLPLPSSTVPSRNRACDAGSRSGPAATAHLPPPASSDESTPPSTPPRHTGDAITSSVSPHTPAKRQINPPHSTKGLLTASLSVSTTASTESGSGRHYQHHRRCASSSSTSSEEGGGSDSSGPLQKSEEGLASLGSKSVKRKQLRRSGAPPSEKEVVRVSACTVFWVPAFAWCAQCTGEPEHVGVKSKRFFPSSSPSPSPLMPTSRLLVRTYLRSTTVYNTNPCIMVAPPPCLVCAIAIAMVIAIAPINIFSDGG